MKEVTPHWRQSSLNWEPRVHVNYSIEISDQARRELREVPSSYRRKILEKIENLGLDPRPRGTRKLSGVLRGYRIRQGPYRIFYSIDDESQLVRVRAVRLRKNAYRLS